jgi:2-polyprenyl-3-methyl-5-hydroxy-6-metoxy-1,4-benzoquinol methylase
MERSVNCNTRSQAYGNDRGDDAADHAEHQGSGVDPQPDGDERAQSVARPRHGDRLPETARCGIIEGQTEITMSTAGQQLADTQEPLEAVIKGEVLRMYQEVADRPDAEFHFFHGRQAAEMFDYPAEWLDRAPAGAVASFAGVGNPHLRSGLRRGETVLDLGSGAGLDSIIAGWQVGPEGRVIGVDLNPAMCVKARAHAAASGTGMECRDGRMEDLPLPDGSVDVVISNGVINLSFRKRRVIQELFRVLKPGGRISITDIVSARPLKSSIVNDPKLWAS